MYCLAALEHFAEMPEADVQQVVSEIALLGQRGFNVNDPKKSYRLRSLPGSFSGLQLVSYMYVGMRQVAPESDFGFDLSLEYDVAQSLPPPADKLSTAVHSACCFASVSTARPRQGSAINALIGRP